MLWRRVAAAGGSGQRQITIPFAQVRLPKPFTQGWQAPAHGR
jgi:hypothetical protein